ncbi:uncharacterized oxidoreductase YrbE-like [Gigantopelta aegis]|uniref:uncharacterized oxidoreductase YrbE-like n=1 Tax=Gigantopelta aegis TaxID=1735272 RepID=UPI001B88D1D2|nr:uncharacterized oxidoreductase YrbE-like [Gigantopelta aegis]
MSTKKSIHINVAIFGLGRIGRRHLQGLARTFRVNIKWIVDDISLHDDIRTLLQKYRLEHVTRLASLEDADIVHLDTSVEVVFVCTPTWQHEDIVKKALTTGKHVFCEKPVALTVETVEYCYALAKENNRILFCAFNKRFDPDFDVIYKKKQNGDLGKVRQLIMISRDPPVPISYIKVSGGIFYDSCIHQLDYVCYFLGERPLTVVAHGNTTSLKADDYRDCNDVDLSTIILTFPSGAIAVIETTRECLHGYDQHLEVLGSKAIAKCGNTPVSASKVLLATGVIQDGCPDVFARFGKSYVVEVDHFLDVVQGKTECLVKPHECIMASELAHLCEESLKTGQVVKVPQKN